MSRRNLYFRHKIVELDSLLKQAHAIVTNNNLYYGLIAENILRCFLRDMLPNRYGVCQGFVENGNVLSRQCDIIVYDKLYYAPSYTFGDVLIVPCESVCTIVEVKTNISKKTFLNMLAAFETLAKMGVSRKYLLLFDGPKIQTFESYFNSWPSTTCEVCVDNQVFDHGDEYMLPSTIINMKRNYYLRQDLVPDFDMMGYMAYGVTDNSGETIACLQSFIEDVLEQTLPHKLDDENPPLLNDNSPYDEDEISDMEVLGGFGLYRL